MARSTRPLVLTAFIVAMAASCQPSAPRTVAFSDPQEAQSNPVHNLAKNSMSAPELVGTIRTREHTVHIHTGQRYTVEDSDGEILVSHLPVDVLREQLPEIFDALDGALAADTWAGVHWREMTELNRSSTSLHSGFEESSSFVPLRAARP
jgi:hypothetical protein